MALRTTEMKVTFQHPFELRGMDGPQPAGTYLVEMDDEPIEGLSFLATRRVATLLHIPAIATQDGGVRQALPIDPADLAAAQAADAGGQSKESIDRFAQGS